MQPERQPAQPLAHQHPRSQAHVHVRSQGDRRLAAVLGVSLRAVEERLKDADGLGPDSIQQGRVKQPPGHLAAGSLGERTLHPRGFAESIVAEHPAGPR